MALSSRIMKSYHEHRETWSETSCVPKHVNAHSFTSGDFSRLTFDVAVRPHSSITVVVLFHSDGRILQAWTSCSPVTDPSIGETEAAFLALSKAKEASLSTFILTGDFTIVLEHLQTVGKLPSLH